MAKTKEVTIPRVIDPGPYRSVDDIREANRDAGFHFFDPDTLRSFSSRIGDTVYGGRFFTSSERSGFDYSSPRRYSVRVAMPDGSVETLGDFLQFTSAAAARRAAAAAAAAPVAVQRDPYSGCEDRDPDPASYEWRAWTIGARGPIMPIGTRNTRAAAEEIARMLNDERNAR